jgi:hypothetical protein
MSSRFYEVSIFNEEEELDNRLLYEKKKKKKKPKLLTITTNAHNQIRARCYLYYLYKLISRSQLLQVLASNDSIIRDVLAPEPMCLPNSVHFFNWDILCLGQEEVNEDGHDNNKASKEQE